MTTGPATPDHPGQEATPLPGVVWGVDVGLARVGVASVVIMRTVVVLPAPLGPRRPKTVPRGTSKLTSSTATKSPKVLTRP